MGAEKSTLPRGNKHPLWCNIYYSSHTLDMTAEPSCLLYLWTVSAKHRTARPKLVAAPPRTKSSR